MPDETHKLQKDPPEGSREVIEGELERQKEGGASKLKQDGTADGDRAKGN